MKRSIISLFLVLLIFSCATHYRAVYDTYLENSENKALSFKDDKFYFEFLPVPNGVYFKIENLTKKPAMIIWDRCYFIEPNNNSSKLLNIDILNEERETVQKTKYESMIPPGAFFSRFTTSALNVDKLTQIKEEKVTNYLVANNLSLVSQSESVGFQEFLMYGRYWPDIGKIKKSKLEEELYKIKNYIEYNNNMGVGFAIQLAEDIFDYKFDFNFKRVSVFEVNPRKALRRKYKDVGELRLVGTMEEEENWGFKYE